MRKYKVVTDYCPKCAAVLDSRHDPKCDMNRAIPAKTITYREGL